MASKDKTKSSTQSKLTDFGPQVTEPNASTSKEASSAKERADTHAETSEAPGATSSPTDPMYLFKEEILGEIRKMGSEFSGRFDNVMQAIAEAQKKMTECTERMDDAEIRLSAVEDNNSGLKTEVERLGKRNKQLEEKMVDLETRSRLNNLRLVNLPEGAEGPDACAFLESWLPEVLDTTLNRNPLALERGHRVGPKRDADAPPRTVVMRFLDYRQKDMVSRAARMKKEILYKNQRVRFYNDVATEAHKQRKQVDTVRQQLRQLGLRHGIIPPATLVLTHRETTHRFTTAAEAQSFITRIQQDK
uniref:LINE-1 type transposase domain-containing protein 1 n=1 Tax=Gouania willdenowi TaxID=441366 RepID=A0A8C5EJ43_GOUWI